MKKISPMLTCLIIVMCMSCDEPQTQNTPIAIDLPVSEFVNKISSLSNEQILDVRTPEEWEAGIINEAILINLRDPDFKVQVIKLDKERPVLVYCHAGGRSAKAMEVLADLGFLEVYNLAGGITEWRKSGAKTVSQ